MLQLPNNCRAGQFSVYPDLTDKEYKYLSEKKLLKMQWRVSYWFYDDNLKQKKKVVLKTGLNSVHTLKERKGIVNFLINEELIDIQKKGYNRITKQFSLEIQADISEYTPLPQAIEWALNHIKVEVRTKKDVALYCANITKAIERLHYSRLPVGQTKRKHIRFILETIGKFRENWSANQFNVHRKYLSMLFSELVQVDAVDANPVKEIAKQVHLRRIRATLTKEERQKVNAHLHTHHYTFWRFLQVFFHSGARITEMLRLQKEDVDLQQQRFKITVKKGGQAKEDYRVIKTIILPLWEQIISEAKAGQYLFSKELKPGGSSISAAQISRRWKLHVKDGAVHNASKKHPYHVGGLGIKADFYALKHLNLEETSALLSINEAQVMAGHSTPVITMTYAQGEKERKLNKLKDLNNAF